MSTAQYAPLALVGGGVAIVGALYMLTNAAIQYVLPAATIAAADRPAADAMRLVAGHWGGTLVSLGMAVSIAATFVGSSLSGARVPICTAARDGLFFDAAGLCEPSLSRIRLRHALILQAGADFPAAAVHRQVPGSVFAGDLCRVAFLCPDREYGLCLSAARAGQ